MIAAVDRLFTEPAQHDPLGVRRRAGVSGSNGADIGQILALSDVLVSQRAFQQQVADQFAAVRRDIADMRQQIAVLTQNTDRQFAEMRQEVAAYHATVVGHGILISELDERLKLVEDRLGPEPL
jgi:hypothetical protein